MSETREPIGRIEVSPEALTTIVRLASLQVEGVTALSGASPDRRGRPFRRGNRGDGITMRMTEDNHLILDVYALMDPNLDIVEIGRNLQAAVKEAMDKMVGLEVAAVNVHVEDVVYHPEKEEEAS